MGAWVVTRIGLHPCVCYDCIYRVTSRLLSGGHFQDDAMEIIQQNEHDRLLELEALANEARDNFKQTLAERGGN